MAIGSKSSKMKAPKTQSENSGSVTLVLIFTTVVVVVCLAPLLTGLVYWSRNGLNCQSRLKSLATHLLLRPICFFSKNRLNSGWPLACRQSKSAQPILTWSDPFAATSFFIVYNYKKKKFDVTSFLSFHRKAKVLCLLGVPLQSQLSPFRLGP